MTALRRVGTPYVGVTVDNVTASMRDEGQGIVESLATAGITAEWNDEIIAVIAYLQRLGAEGKQHLAQQQGGN
jgi:cbb3-type cytochrome oxidase cytochrome c subunit